MQGTIGRLTQILRASSIVTTGSDEYVDLMGAWKILRDDFVGPNGKRLHLVYQSLSEKEYASIIEFDVSGQPLRTRFVER